MATVAEDTSRTKRLLQRDITLFEASLAHADSTQEVRTLLADQFPFVSQEHLDFLEREGGAEKLRELYYEVIKFDLLHGTKTSHFISAESLQETARTNPELFASTDAALHTVRHRSSQTSSVVDALNICVRSLQNKGLSKKATLFDMGCGTGKILITAMNEKSSPNFSQHFKKAVGVDYHTPFLDIARENLQSPKIKVDPNKKITLSFADAATYEDFNGVNVVVAYNPFDEEIMQRVEKNMRKVGGNVIFAYIKPEHENVFQTEKGWKTIQTVESNDPDRRIKVFERGFAL